MINAIELHLGRELPGIYRNFLRRFDEYSIISFRCDAEVLNRGSWTFVGEKGLGRDMDSKQGKEFKWWQVLAYYWMDACDEGMKKRPGYLGFLDVKAVEKKLAIAYDEGDVLYIDASNDFRVGVYFQDSSEVVDSEIGLEEIFSVMKLVYSV